MSRAIVFLSIMLFVGVRFCPGYAREEANLGKARRVAPAHALKAPAQAAKQPQWKSREEYDAFTAMADEKDAKKKVLLGEAFLAKFADSDFRGNAYVLMAHACHELGQSDKAIESARKALEADPDNLDALSFLSFVFPFIFKADDPEAPTKLTRAESDAKHGLELLPKLLKPTGMSEDDFNQAIKGRRAVFNSTIGFVAFRRKDYAAALAALKVAVEDNPGNYYTFYHMGLTYLYSSPPDYSQALWCLGRAVSLARAAQDPNGRQFQEFLKQVYINYHGDEEGLPEVITLAASSVNPPEGFKIEAMKTQEKTGQADSGVAKGVDARLGIAQDTGPLFEPPSEPPTETQRRAFDAAQRVKLLVKTLPGQAPTTATADPYQESAVLLCKKALEGMGLSVVDSSAADFDVTLELELTTLATPATKDVRYRYKTKTPRPNLSDYVALGLVGVVMPPMLPLYTIEMVRDLKNRKKDEPVKAEPVKEEPVTVSVPPHDRVLGRISFVFPSGGRYTRPFAGWGDPDRHCSVDNSVLWASGGFGDNLFRSLIELGEGIAPPAKLFLFLASPGGHTWTCDSHISLIPEYRPAKDQEEGRVSLHRSRLAIEAEVSLVRLGWKPTTLEEKVAWHLYWGEEYTRLLSVRAFWFHGPHMDRDEAKRLAQLGGHAVPLLIPHLKDEDLDRRMTAAEALGEMREKSALPTLEQALAKEQVPVVKRAMKEAIREIRR